MTTSAFSSATGLRTARCIPARLVTTLALAMVGLNQVSAQTSFTSTGNTTAWNTTRWNNTSDAAPYGSTYTANNNVSFTSGNYTFAGMGATVNVGNVTLSDNVNVTFTSATNTFATNGTVRTITVGNNSTFDLAGQSISTTAGTGFIKNGNGTLSLTGSAYTGGFTLNAGTIASGGTLGMGNGSLTINGGTIRSTNTGARDFSTRFTSGITIGGNFTLGDAVNNGALTFASSMALGSSDRVITVNSAATFAGNMTGAAGVGFTKQGAGTLTLSGTNAYTGNTTISSGTLSTTKALALAGYTTAGRVIFNGGTLGVQVGGSGWTTGEVDSMLGNATKTSGALGIDTTTGNLTQWAAFTPTNLGVLGLTKLGANTLTLNATNTYTGVTTISAGTLSVDTINNGGTAGALGNATSAAANIVFDGGTLLYTGANATSDRAFTIISGKTALINVGANSSISLSGATGAATTGGLQKIGLGTLTLTGNNTHTGVTTINGSGSGTLVLSGDNTAMTGGVTANTGSSNATLSPQLVVNSATALGTGTLTFGGGAASDTVRLDNTSGGGITLTTNNAFTLNRDFTFVGTNSLNLGNMTTTLGGMVANGNRSITITANTLTFGGPIGASGTNLGVIKNGSGTLVFSGANTYNGTTRINAGVLSINSIANADGTASALGAPTDAVNGTLSIGSGSTAGTLVYTGTGNATTDRVINLSGTSGGAIINQSGASGSLKFTSGITATGVGNKTFTLQGSTAGTGEISGAIIDNNSITGITSVSKSGTGTWILSGNNTYTGATTISGGTLALSGGNNILANTGAVNVSTSGATFDISAVTTGETIGSLAGVSGANVVLGSKALAVGDATNTTFSGVISGVNGSLTKQGNGALALSGNNTYSGGTNVTGGTLLVGASAVPSGTGTVSGSPIGTGNLTLGDGTTLASTSSSGRSLYVPAISIGGNITIGQAATGTGRVSLAGTIDLGSGERTITLGKASPDYASGNEVLRFEGNATFGTTTTIQNGSLIVTTLTGNATNPSIIRTGSGATANFAGNLPLTLDDGVAYSTGTGSVFGTGSNAPALTLNAAVTRGGGILQMGDGTSGGSATMRNAEVYSLSGGGTVSSSNTSGNATTGTLTINNGNGATFTGNITQAGTGIIALVKTGTGTQTLAGTNTYTGGTTISNGTLIISGGNSAPGSFTLDGPSATTALKLSNTAALATTATLTGSSSSANTGTVDLAAAGDYTLGSYNVGSMKFTASSGNPTSLTFTNNSTFTSGSAGGRTINNNDANLSIVFAGSLDISSTANNTVAITGSGNTTVNGPVFNNASGIRGLEKNGSGTLTLNGDNSYDGVSDFKGSGLVLINGNTSASTGAVNVSSSATLGGSGTVGGAVTLSSTASIGSAGNTLGLAGTLTTTGTNTLNASSIVNVAGGTTITSGTFTVNGTLGGGIAVGGAGNTLNGSGNVTGTTTVSGGTINGTLSLGTLIATGNSTISSAVSTLSGTTVQSGGILNVNGSLGGGAITVDSGATLKGNGVVSGATTINGDLAPGASPGGLTFSSSLTLAGTTTMEIDGTVRGVGGSYDAVDVAGLLTYGGTLTMSFGNPTSAGTTYDLFGLGGGTAGGFGAVSIGGIYAASLTNSGGTWTADDLTNMLTFTFVESTGDLAVTSYTPIPEPSGFAAMVGAGMIGFAFYRRRRHPVKHAA